MSKPFKHKKRKRNKLKRNDFIALAVCALVFGGFLCTVFGQEQNLSTIRKEQISLEEEIAIKKEQLRLLEEKEEKNSGDEFYEEKARDEGYVREDETLFVVGN